MQSTKLIVFIFLSIWSPDLCQSQEQFAGPFQLILRQMEQCEDSGTRQIHSSSTKISKVSRTKYVYSTNITTEIDVNDDLSFEMDIAVFGNGGWRPHFMQMDFSQACTSLKQLMPKFYVDVVNNAHAECPVPPVSNKGYTKGRGSGNIFIMMKQEILQRWVGHIKVLLTHSDTEDALEDALEDYQKENSEEENEQPLDFYEVTKVIHKMKNNSNLGMDGLKQLNFLNMEAMICNKTLYNLILHFTMLTDWKNRIICTVLKKDVRLDCTNCRRSTSYKILSGVLFKRWVPMLNIEMKWNSTRLALEGENLQWTKSFP